MRTATSGLALARALAGLMSPRGRRGRLAIFGYHQVLERPDPLRPGEPDTRQFEADLEVIGRLFNVLPLAEAVARMAEGRLPARAACITFDDGYANNHELAAPLLESAGLPATFFITAGAVDEGVMWNDLVIEAVARRREGLVLDGVLDGVLERDVSTDVEPPRLVTTVLQSLKYQPVRRRWESALRIFRENTGEDPPRLMMTRAMVADLARRGFEIGGHTMSHPILAKMSDEDARLEIERCGEWIHDVTGSRPRTFAYPNGRVATDFTDAHKRMVAAAGFRAAASTEWGLAGPKTDPFSLPRIGPWWRSGPGLLEGLLRSYGRSRLTGS